MLGAEHPNTLLARSNLGAVLLRLRDLRRALPLLQETRDARMRMLGGGHPDTLHAQNLVAHGFAALGDLDGAVDLLEQAVDQAQRTLGSDHPLTESLLANLTRARERRTGS